MDRLEQPATSGVGENDAVYLQYLDDGDSLKVSRGLAQAIGLNPAIVLRQIFYWLDINRKTDRKDHFKDGLWWTYNTYADWVEENFDFWSYDTVRRTLLQLVELGLLYEGNYNRRAKDRTKWYTINYGAFLAFMRLWTHHGSPRCAGGSKNPAYKAFLEDWEMHKVLYSNFATCKQSSQLANKSRKLLSALPETTDTNQKEKRESPARKVQKPKAAPRKKVVDFKPPEPAGKKLYEDIPHAVRLGIIMLWNSNLRAQQPRAFKNEANQDAAADIARAGYTERDVERFVQWAMQQKFWKGKTLTLAKVCDLLPDWLIDHPEHPVTDAPTIAPPSKEDVDRATDGSQFRRFDKDGNFLGFGHGDTNTSEVA